MVKIKYANWHPIFVDIPEEDPNLFMLRNPSRYWGQKTSKQKPMREDWKNHIVPLSPPPNVGHGRPINFNAVPKSDEKGLNTFIRDKKTTQ